MGNRRRLHWHEESSCHFHNQLPATFRFRDYRRFLSRLKPDQKCNLSKQASQITISKLHFYLDETFRLVMCEKEEACLMLPIIFCCVFYSSRSSPFVFFNFGKFPFVKERGSMSSCDS